MENMPMFLSYVPALIMVVLWVGVIGFGFHLALRLVKAVESIADHLKRP
jgi:hypothetical protein